VPSTTSTMTTVRASSFSATRCAVVAPTFPAPTTVILLTMFVFRLEGIVVKQPNSAPTEAELTEPGDRIARALSLRGAPQSALFRDPERRPIRQPATAPAVRRPSS